jgi:steroid delta-isomerase-like uncharacterized protein
LSREINIATQRRLTDNLNDGDVEAAVLAFSERVVDHDPAPGQGRGREGLRTLFEELSEAFTDLHVEPVRLVADDQHVSIAYTLTGIHDGPFQGIEPTGRRVQVRGMQIARFHHGEIIERWGRGAAPALAEQLSAEPDAGGTSGRFGRRGSIDSSSQMP